MNQSRFIHNGVIYVSKPTNGIDCETLCEKCAFIDQNCFALTDIPPCSGRFRDDQINVIFVKESIA